jgi:hypothetical protein
MVDVIQHPLKAHEREVLLDLEFASFRSPQPRAWLRAGDVGGRDSTHHCNTLTKLWRLGLALRRARPTLGRRNAWEYRVSALGRAHVEVLRLAPSNDAPAVLVAMDESRIARACSALEALNEAEIAEVRKRLGRQRAVDALSGRRTNA